MSVYSIPTDPIRKGIQHILLHHSPEVFTAVNTGLELMEMQNTPAGNLILILITRYQFRYSKDFLEALRKEKLNKYELSEYYEDLYWKLDPIMIPAEPKKDREEQFRRQKLWEIMNDPGEMLPNDWDEEDGDDEEDEDEAYE